jgi:hypothetical protein
MLWMPTQVWYMLWSVAGLTWGCRLSSSFVVRLFSFNNEETFSKTLSVSKQACTNSYLLSHILTVALRKSLTEAGHIPSFRPSSLLYCTTAIPTCKVMRWFKRDCKCSEQLSVQRPVCKWLQKLFKVSDATAIRLALLTYFMAIWKVTNIIIQKLWIK